MRRQLASTPLFWRVFWGNAAVLVLAVAALALGPLHVSAPLGLTGSSALLAGVVVALVDQPPADASGLPSVRRAGGPNAPA